MRRNSEGPLALGGPGRLQAPWGPAGAEETPPESSSSRKSPDAPPPPQASPDATGGPLATSCAPKPASFLPAPAAPKPDRKIGIEMVRKTAAFRLSYQYAAFTLICIV